MVTIDVEELEDFQLVPDCPETILAIGAGDQRKAEELALEDPQVSGWLKLMASYDLGLVRHSIRVASLTDLLSVHLGYCPEERVALIVGALLHDVGKLAVPLSLLNKPGVLNRGEMQIMRSHPQKGYEMLRQQGSYSREVLAIVRDHHERLDGSGYPRELRAECISDHVRVVSLCDVYAAMTETRPYAEAMHPREALEIMLAQRGRLDMQMIESFKLCLP